MQRESNFLSIEFTLFSRLTLEDVLQSAGVHHFPQRNILSKIRFKFAATLFLGVSASSEMFTKTAKITGSDASDK